jgi:predicted nucleic acid-binding protein
MRRGVLWDSSAVLAVLDAHDAYHRRAVDAMARIAAERRPSFMTNYVAAEAHALVLSRLGRTVAREWLFSDSLPVVRALPQDEDRAKVILATHNDKDWSLCDAISFAVLESHGVRTAFTFDHHFRQYGRCDLLGLGT